MKNLDPNTVIKVAICDDHALFRTGVKTSLSARKDIQMVAEAENGGELKTFEISPEAPPATAQASPAPSSAQLWTHCWRHPCTSSSQSHCAPTRRANQIAPAGRNAIS